MLWYFSEICGIFVNSEAILSEIVANPPVFCDVNSLSPAICAKLANKPSCGSREVFANGSSRPAHHVLPIRRMPDNPPTHRESQLTGNPMPGCLQTGICDISKIYWSPASCSCFNWVVNALGFCGTFRFIHEDEMYFRCAAASRTNNNNKINKYAIYALVGPTIQIHLHWQYPVGRCMRHDDV